MKKDDYVSSHDFGYGRDGENKINRLHLRNLKDCEIYINNILKTGYVATFHRNTLKFLSNSQKVQVNINLID